MKEQWKQDSGNEKFYPKSEGHEAVPIQFELPVVAHAQSNKDYCKKTIATLKVLVLLVLLVLLSWMSITLYTNYRPKSILFVDDETTHEYFGRFGRAASKSNVHLDSSQNAASNITSLDNLNANYSNKNNSQMAFGYNVKTRVTREADILQLKEGTKKEEFKKEESKKEESKKEELKKEEFKKWLQNLNDRDLFTGNASENLQLKADLKRFLDDPGETSDDVGKLFTQVVTKYKDTLFTVMKNAIHSGVNKENDAADFDDSKHDDDSNGESGFNFTDN